jgi:hypothetical protein
MNTATFDSIIPYIKDDFVRIGIKGSDKSIDNNIFVGYVTDCNPGNDGVYSVECIEQSDLLYRSIAIAPGDLIFRPRIIIRTPDGNNSDYTIGRMVTAILSYFVGKTDWTPGTGISRSRTLDSNSSVVDVSGLTTVPGMDDIKIDTQVLSGISVGKALTAFLCSQCGLYVWYDYRNAGLLEYGFMRDKITIDPTTEVIEHNYLVSSGTEDHNIEGVVIVNVDGSHIGTAGLVTAGSNIVMYQLASDKLDTTLDMMAAKILEYNTGSNTRTYKLTFPAGTVRFREGDWFDGIGDATVSGGETAWMEYKSGEDFDPINDSADSVWQIKEMTITNTGTEVIVGSSFYSILDVYKDKITKVRDGIPAPVDSYTVSTKEIIVGGSLE